MRAAGKNGYARPGRPAHKDSAGADGFVGRSPRAHQDASRSSSACALESALARTRPEGALRELGGLLGLGLRDLAVLLPHFMDGALGGHLDLPAPADDGVTETPQIVCHSRVPFAREGERKALPGWTGRADA